MKSPFTLCLPSRSLQRAFQAAHRGTAGLWTAPSQRCAGTPTLRNAEHLEPHRSVRAWRAQL